MELRFSFASARRLSEHCYLLALANKQAQGLRFGGTLKSGMCVSGEAGARPALWLSRTAKLLAVGS